MTIAGLLVSCARDATRAGAVVLDHELLGKGNVEVPGAADEAIAVLRGLIREVIVHPADDAGFESRLKANWPP